MIIRRTANAGVLLTLDGVRILLDGVCKELSPYLGTPAHIREELMRCVPDIVGFTHGHKDHFDRSFAQSLYEKNLRSVLGPEDILRQGISQKPAVAGNVTVTPIKTRHIGKAGQDTRHMSFLIKGSQTLLFTGDAAPTEFKEHPKVDVLIAPYAYAITPSGWQMAQRLADTVVIVHMPDRHNDPQNLWTALEQTTGQGTVLLPYMGEELQI